MSRPPAKPTRKKLDFERLVVQAEFIGRHAIDHIDAKMFAPAFAPLGFVEPLHHQHEFLDVRRDGLEPGVVGLRIFFGGRVKSFDDGAKGAPAD